MANRREILQEWIDNDGEFDGRETTQRLETLSLADLHAICERELYKPCLQRIVKLRNQLDGVFVQKTELIELMMWSSIAQLPLLLLGSWGTAKSMLVRMLSRGLGIEPDERSIVQEDEWLDKLHAAAKVTDAASADRLKDPFQLIGVDREARHFEYLVTRFTTPEELLGPVNVPAMLDHSLHLRQTRALMPRAEIVFLDEVFKANSAILNALLSIINERIFYNAGLPWKVNMVMLFGASNELPDEHELGAFLDRFPVRALCESVDDDHLEDLLEAAFANKLGDLLPSAPDAADRKLFEDQFVAARQSENQRKGEPAKQIGHCASINDFRLLNKVALYKFGPYLKGRANDPHEDFHRSFREIYRDLRRQYDISDRSFSHFYQLARAKALLEGRTQLLEKDCRVFQYCGKSVDALRVLPSVVDDFLPS